MNRYPDVACIDRDDYIYETDDGIETMVASDGSYKTHVLHTITACRFRLSHRLINSDDRERIMRFYRENKAREFIFENPDTGDDVIVRFANRPQVIEYVGSLRTLRVELAGGGND